MYVAEDVPRGMLTGVPYGTKVFTLVNCNFKEPMPDTEQEAFIDALIPTTVALEGIDTEPWYATKGSCACPDVRVIVVLCDKEVILAGLLHACPPAGRTPACVGTCTTLLWVPDNTEA